ncbi:TIGR04283 family arsenosugar biosynthesis glycosyltransferase [Geobacter pickeringii]|uniref:Glycosyl transferase n=1 Tax=Geobacter pickeringii TaxID=345632 RepID=A0A0B5BLH7_9BACT|nr:TIGR04283 family arsenosugar biosynthesis glycosyltransferase [Geobacter pickeringii]AJE04906.1 glycosyl transferase [Geobacter pickeringii]
MPSRSEAPHISVIVPVLNEAPAVAPLLGTLAAQRGVTLELVIADGGSDDGTVAAVRALAAEVPFPVTVVTAGRGRGRQMNAGCRASRSGTLLFLHADCAFPDPRALLTARESLETAIARRGDGRVAGHFRLRFARSDAAPALPWHFYEWKARLHRAGCTHGDQGLLIRRSFFEEAGPFDESLPILEDVALAARVAAAGEWLLLPGEIVTSARRFEVEGVRERQTVNALLMNFAHIGWSDGVAELVAGYRLQGGAERLHLAPILRRIDGLLRRLPRAERRRLWHATGGYVRGNAWQLPFALDARRHFRAGDPPGSGEATLLALHDRFFDRLTDNRGGTAAAALLTWLWFRLSLRRERPDEKKRAEDLPRPSVR